MLDNNSIFVSKIVLDMNPTVLVTENLPKIPKASKRILSFILILLVISAVVLGGVYLYKYLTSKPTQPSVKNIASSQTNLQAFKKKDLKGDLEKQLKLTFSSTKYYQDINLYMNLGSKANTTEQAYTNWLKAYNFVSKAYTDTKRAEYRTVLVQFREFLKAFPMYKDSEVVIPK